jgi:hypothetical protein
MYESPEVKHVPSEKSVDSHVTISDEIIKGKKTGIGIQKCPKKRRPNEYMKCNSGYRVKLNPQGFPCCYKKKKGAPESESSSPPPPPPSPPRQRERPPPQRGPQSPPYDGPPKEYFINEFETVYKKDGPDGAKRAYRKMTLLYHPDKHQNEAAKFEVIFKVFQSAWNTFKARKQITGGEY